MSMCMCFSMSFSIFVSMYVHIAVCVLVSLCMWVCREVAFCCQLEEDRKILSRPPCFRKTG